MRISIYRPAKLARNGSYMVAPVRQFGYLRSSGFDDVTVFKSLHSGERFRMAPFSVIVFGVVVWTSENDKKTVSVDGNLFENGAKQLRFQTISVDVA